MILYSKFLPGFPKFEEEARKFREELQEAGITDADFSVFYTAGKISTTFDSLAFKTTSNLRKDLKEENSRFQCMTRMTLFMSKQHRKHFSYHLKGKNTKWVIGNEQIRESLFFTISQ